MILYESENIAQAPWPDTIQGRWARTYLSLLVREGTHRFFSDITPVRVIGIDDILIPITIGEIERDNSHLSSTFGRYIRHPRTALSRQTGLRPALMSGALAVLGGFLTAIQIDKCIYVNNWLLFRGVNPSLSRTQLKRLTDFLVKRFPDYAIVFPVVNPLTNHDWAIHLSKCGYSMLYAGHTRMLFPYGPPMSRQERENRRRDAKLLQTSGYELVDANEVSGCAPRLAELYHALNGRKYTTNVTIYAEFIERAIQDRFVTVRVLRKSGRIDGFYGYVVNDGVAFCPLFGYDTTLPQELGLYRMLVYRLVQDALDRGLISETGAGADKFKSVRGDIPVPKYGAFFVDHLPAYRRLGWEALRAYVTGPYRTLSLEAVKRVDGPKAKGFDIFPPVFETPAVELTQWGIAPRQALESLRKAVDNAARLDGEQLEQMLKLLSKELNEWPYSTQAIDELKSRVKQLEQRVQQLREARQEKDTASQPTVSELLENAERRGSITLVVRDVGKVSPQDLRAAATGVLQVAPSAAVFLAASHAGKAILVAALTEDLIAHGFSAGAMMSAIAPIVGGQGGGKPEMAFGGGIRSEAISQALVEARRYIEDHLLPA